MSASGQKRPLNSIQILASEWLLSGYTGHSPLRISGGTIGCFRPEAVVDGHKFGQSHISLAVVCIRSATARLCSIEDACLLPWCKISRTRKQTIPTAFQTQSHSMEVLFQFLDDLDDLAVATAFRLRRQLSRRTRERRRVPRTGPTVSRHER